VYRGFFSKPAPDVAVEEFKEAPMVMVVPLFLTAVISVLLGIYPEVFASIIKAFAHF
jgi:multicomponent Na+:H+ antiporter subunit D